jgi:hypothetical protein
LSIDSTALRETGFKKDSDSGNTQDYWVFGPCPLSGIVKKTFWKHPVFKTLCSLQYQTMGKSKNPVISSGFKILPFQNFINCGLEGGKCMCLSEIYKKGT